jgi:hypothetical protein
MAQGNCMREKMTNHCVCDVSCQALRLRQLVREISKLVEIIHNLGISTHQSKKLFTFLPDTSAHQILHFFLSDGGLYEDSYPTGGIGWITVS